jgi:iron(III) transport system ATP-binding protein
LKKAEIRGLTKKYGKTIAVDSLDLDIYEKEILAIVGPSGCGKTTLLRLIAGLDKPDEGNLVISGEKIVSIKDKIFILPEKRQIGLVFQNYAIWPHKNVFQNIAYPLKIRKKNKEYIKKEVEKALDLVKLSGKENRYPHELSGGEKQRVALARAIVMKPKLLLLDEPLSNLDAKLREEMQYEIKRIHKELGVTIVHVTHDQYEAMGIAHRIAVMKNGQIVQINTPKEIYDKPKTKFVASFIGKSNLINSRITENGIILDLAKGIIINDDNIIKKNQKDGILSIRPEDITLNAEKGLYKGKIVNYIYRGNLIDYAFKVGDRILNIQTSTNERYEIGDELWFDLLRATRVEE